MKVSNFCLTPNEQFFSYTMASTHDIRWDGNDICFVLDQNAQLHYSDSELTSFTP